MTDKDQTIKPSTRIPSDYEFTIRIVQLHKGYVVVDEENGVSHYASDLHHIGVVAARIIKIREVGKADDR